MGRVLRPGGLIDISEFDFHLYDANHRRIELDVNELGPPWYARWMTHVLKAIIESGGDVDAATHLHEWILNNSMFEDVVYREIWVPVVPAPRDPSNDSEYLRRMDQTLNDDCEVSVASMFFLSALSYPCTRPSFEQVALSFWGMALNRKPSICSRIVPSRR